MRKKTQEKLVIIALGIIFALFLSLSLFQTSNLTSDTNNVFENQNEHNEKIILKSSGYWVLSPFEIDGDATGVGAHNWTWVENQLWFGGGDGSKETPYIIENITIDGQGSGSCFYIRDSSKHFIIRNSTVFGSGSNWDDAGINLYNTNNGTIFNNTCSFNNNYGIYLWHANNNTILDNTANNNTNDGIYMDDCNNTIISKNIANNNEKNGINLRGNYSKILNNTANFNRLNGIFLENSHNNTILNNTLRNNLVSGIKINLSWNNTLRGNLMYKCGFLSTDIFYVQYISHIIDTTNLVNGKHLYFYVKEIGLGADNFSDAGQVMLLNCKDSIISNIDVSHGTRGIFLFFSSNNTIINVNASHNTFIGIQLENSNNNTVIKNNATYNRDYGILIHESNSTNILKNNATNNGFIGILIEGSINNTICNNDAIENDIAGIAIIQSDNNTISENTANNNSKYGIGMVWSNYNNITENTVNENIWGIYLENSDYNNISGNTLVGNVFCITEIDCIGNTIENNDNYTKIMSAGINDLELEPYTTDDIDVNLTIALNDDTRVFFSAFNENPSDVNLDDGIIFMNLGLNDTNNLDTIYEDPINITIQYNASLYENVKTFWFNSSANDGAGAWEEIPFTDLGNGIIVISIDHTSYFALCSTEIIIIPGDGDGGDGDGGGKDDGGETTIAGYNIFILIGAICIVSIVLIKRRRN